jgi:chromosome partitioning protein
MITIGIISNKGGQGKTTTAATLAHGLTLKGKRVLLVDCDDQGDIATNFDVTTEGSPTLYHVIAQRTPPQDVIQEIRPNLHAILSDQTLVAAVQALQGIEEDITRVSQLRTLCDNVQDEGYDFVIFDGKPGQNDLVYNIIMASQYLYLPVNVSGADFLALAGLGTFLQAIHATCQDFDQDLGHWYEQIRIIPYFYKPREPDSQRDFSALTEKYGELVTTPIRYSQALANAVRRGQTIFEYQTIFKNLGLEDFTKLVDLTLAYAKAPETKDEAPYATTAIEA